MRGRLLAAGFALALFGVSTAWADPLAIQSNYESSRVPLTTEGIWKLAPDELNPHRTRWLLDRHLELIGPNGTEITTRKMKNGDYAIDVGGIYSRSVSYIRGPKDPAYSPLSDFPCTKSPVTWFATVDGTRLAADSAARIWDELLSREQIKLSIYLRHVHGESPEDAIHSAEAALARWQDGLDRDWEAKVLTDARAGEWKYYRKRAQETGVCAKAHASDHPLGRWEPLMEPPQESGTPELLARAPARRWGGLFSVLVSVKVGALELVGKFLIDSAAPHSVISPLFLQNQGALASSIELPKGLPRRISWSGGSGIAVPAYVEEAKVGGLVLPIHDFYLHDTDFFGPPESFSTCCDGILGSDFLRQYVVEFTTGKGPEVNLYAREGFHPKLGASREPWTEAYFDSGEEVVSDCVARPAKSIQGPELRGVRWDTGSEEAIQFEREPPPKARDVSRWDLSCGSLEMANAMAIESPDREGDQEMTGLVPLDLGMQLMGRGDFTFDLGHGRIWFNPQALALPVVQNHSGLGVEFIFDNGERYLKVTSIRKGSAAESLRKAGLRPGMTLLSLNTKSADEMDTWAVEQRLSGVYGQSVTVEWETGRGKKKSSKTAVLKLPPISE